MNGWKGRVAAALPSSVWKFTHSSFALIDQLLTLRVRKKVPHLEEANTIGDVRCMTAKHIQLMLEEAGCTYVEEHVLGKPRYRVPHNDLVRAKSVFDSSGMILEEATSTEEIDLSLFALSLRKNVATAVSIPLIGDTTDSKALHASGFNHPVDVVYTWVDSESPEWKKDFSEAFAKYGSSAPRTSSDMVRFQDRDELKYSLRSLEMFAPWINHIYIVTNGQIPDWLDLTHPKISLVTHADIFEKTTDLPTFNSHAIEANLHRIPGLNEHFLYFNDDVFLANVCTPEAFFTPSGKSKYFESQNRVPLDPSVTDLPSNWAAFNVRQLLEQHFGYAADKKFKHTAHAQRLSTLKKAAQQFEEHLNQTIEKKFRHRRDVALPSNLAHHYGNILGTAVPAEIDYRYIDISSDRADIELSRLLLWDNPAIFCLNQVSSKSFLGDVESVMIQEFLKNYFPWKSSAEL